MKNNMNHLIIMGLVCFGALGLILVLPMLGFSKGWATGISLVLMIGMHLWMMRGHQHNHKIPKGDKK